MLGTAGLLRLAHLVYQLYPACMTTITNGEMGNAKKCEDEQEDMQNLSTVQEAIDGMNANDRRSHSSVADRLLDMVLQLERYFSHTESTLKVDNGTRRREYCDFDLLLLLENCLAPMYPRNFKIWWHMMFLYEDAIRNFPIKRDDEDTGLSPVLLQIFRRRYQETLHRLHDMSGGRNLIVLWKLVQWYEPPVDVQTVHAKPVVAHELHVTRESASLLANDRLVQQILSRDAEYQKLTERHRGTALALQYALQCLDLLNHDRQPHMIQQNGPSSEEKKRLPPALPPPLNPLHVKEKCISLLMKANHYVAKDKNALTHDANLVQAERLALQLVQETHNNPRSLFLLSTVHVRKADFEKALLCLEQALEIEHKHFTIHSMERNPLISMELKRLVFSLEHHKGDLTEPDGDLAIFPKSLQYQTAEEYWNHIMDRYKIVTPGHITALTNSHGG